MNAAIRHQFFVESCSVVFGTAGLLAQAERNIVAIKTNFFISYYSFFAFVLIVAAEFAILAVVATVVAVEATSRAEFQPAAQPVVAAFEARQKFAADCTRKNTDYRIAPEQQWALTKLQKLK